MDASNSNLEKVTDILKRKYLGCPNCGALNAEVHSKLGLPFQESGLAQETIVALPVICTSCGFISLFAVKSLMPMG